MAAQGGSQAPALRPPCPAWLTSKVGGPSTEAKKERRAREGAGPRLAEMSGDRVAFYKESPLCVQGPA